MTTDVVLWHKWTKDAAFLKQVVGRAQRPGRTSTLCIWQLLYTNEGDAQE